MRSKLVTFCTLLFSTNNTIQNTLCKYRIHEEKFYIFVCFCCRFIFVEIFKLWKLNIPLASASTIFSATLCVIHILDKIINHRSSRLSCIFVHAQIENPKFVSQIIIKRVFFHPFLFSSLLLASPLYNVIFRNFCLLSRWYGTEALHLQFKRDENTHCIFYRRFLIEIYDWMKLNSWADRIEIQIFNSIWVFFANDIVCLCIVHRGIYLCENRIKNRFNSIFTNNKLVWIWNMQ